METKYSTFVTIVVLAVLASQVNCAAVKHEGGNDTVTPADFGMALKNYYLAFQRIMPCGYPKLMVPVMAPFTLDNYSFNFSNGYFSTEGSISNLMVSGLNDFTFLATSYNASTYRMTFDVIYPEIAILGECEFDVKAFLAGFPVHMAKSGLINMKMTDYRIVAGLTVTPIEVDGRQGMQITDLNINFYLADALFNNWNNLWDISANNFVNKWSREFVLMATQQIQVQLDDIYSSLFLPSLNSMLSDVSMAEATHFFVEMAKELNAADCNM